MIGRLITAFLLIAYAQAASAEACGKTVTLDHPETGGTMEMHDEHGGLECLQIVIPENDKTLGMLLKLGGDISLPKGDDMSRIYGFESELPCSDSAVPCCLILTFSKSCSVWKEKLYGECLGRVDMKMIHGNTSMALPRAATSRSERNSSDASASVEYKYISAYDGILLDCSDRTPPPTFETTSEDNQSVTLENSVNAVASYEVCGKTIPLAHAASGGTVQIYDENDDQRTCLHVAQPENNDILGVMIKLHGSQSFSEDTDVTSVSGFESEALPDDPEFPRCLILTFGKSCSVWKEKLNRKCRGRVDVKMIHGNSTVELFRGTSSGSEGDESSNSSTTVTYKYITVYDGILLDCSVMTTESSLSSSAAAQTKEMLQENTSITEADTPHSENNTSGMENQTMMSDRDSPKFGWTSTITVPTTVRNISTPENEVTYVMIRPDETDSTSAVVIIIIAVVVVVVVAVAIAVAVLIKKKCGSNDAASNKPNSGASGDSLLPSGRQEHGQMGTTPYSSMEMQNMP